MGPLIKWHTLCYTTERLWNKGFSISKYQRSFINEFAIFQDCIKGFSSENRFCKDTHPPKVFNFPVNERPKLFFPAMSMVFLCISAPTVVATRTLPPPPPSSSPPPSVDFTPARRKEEKRGKEPVLFTNFLRLKFMRNHVVWAIGSPNKRSLLLGTVRFKKFFLHLVLIVFLGEMWKCATYHIFFSTVGK